MGSRLKLVGRMAVSIILLIGLLTGCASNQSSSPEPTNSNIEFELDISFVAWRTSSEGTGSCALGPVVADFLGEGVSVRVYDESNGDLLASGNLSIKSKVGSACSYGTERFMVPRVSFYRTVVDGRHTEISSFVDLKVTADEFRSDLGYESLPDLWLIKEYGWQ